MAWAVNLPASVAWSRSVTVPPLPTVRDSVENWLDGGGGGGGGDEDVVDDVVDEDVELFDVNVAITP